VLLDVKRTGRRAPRRIRSIENSSPSFSRNSFDVKSVPAGRTTSRAVQSEYGKGLIKLR
jgi:hypothetical protein